MKRVLKKSLCVTATLLMMSGLFSNTKNVLADNPDEYTDKNALMSLLQYMPDGYYDYVAPQKAINDTYWADLEEGSVL